MHAGIVAHWLSRHPVVRHAKRAAVLVRAVGALLSGGKLALTQLGRSMPGRAQVKHQIKAVDRLLGNPHLQRERDDVYRAVAACLLRENSSPVVLVDWSDFELERQFVMLRAAVPVAGRAIAIYEKVFPFRRYNSPGAHREFLAALKSILPPGCRPILVTDAGFRGPWFRDVEALGWHWIGRIRNRIKYFREETGRWCYTDSLYPEATPKTAYVGDLTLSKRYRYRCHVYLVRAYQPRIGRPRHRRSKSPNATTYRKLHRAPWLLATSLPHERGSGPRIRKVYALRMQIEESFRDLKCHRWGFGLRYARCRDEGRLDVLLLIGTLAMLVVWLAGLAAQARGWDRQMQANTERRRTVLSAIFVGRELLRRERDLDPLLLFGALPALQWEIVQAAAW
jgi:hypothetical protein